MEERFLRPTPGAPAGPSFARRAVDGIRYFLTLALGTTAAIAALGVLIGMLSGHGALTSLIYGLWIGGGILLLFGGAGGGGMGGGGVAARQTPGRRLLPDQVDPLGLILLGAVPIGIGVLIAVLTHRA